MRALFLLLLLTLQQLPPRDRPAPGPSARAIISGRVYSQATGAPVPDVFVILTSQQVESGPLSTAWSPLSRSPGGRVTETDATGTFLLAGVEPGQYRLVAKPGPYSGRYLAAGYGTVRASEAGTSIVVKGGDQLRGLDIALPSAAAIEGRVADENGNPLALMPVIAARIMAGSDSPQRVPHVPVVTDDLGRYRIFGLEPGDYVIAAEGHRIVTSGAYDERAGAGTIGHAATQPTTTFHRSALNEIAAQRVRATAARDATSIDIIVVRAGRFEVSGTVLDSRGVPAAAANGQLARIAVSGVATHPFYTDAHGRFRVTALEPGDYRLLIGRGGPVNERTEFADLPMTVADHLQGLVVATIPGATVSGRLVPAESQPLDTQSLRISLERVGPPVRTVETIATIDGDGRFRAADVFGPHLVRVAGLPAGSTLDAVLLRGDDITDVPTVFRAEDGDQVRVVISSRGSTVAGEIKDGGDRPGGEATVYVFGQDRTAWRMTSPRTVRVDAVEGGRFSVSGLAGGRYYAIAIAREGFRVPADAGEAFFALLSSEATPFVIGDDERRALDLRLWRWPE